MAHSERMVSQLREYLEWIAPITVYPGEDELQALAEGVFRALDGEEQAKRLQTWGSPPPGTGSGYHGSAV
jgi:butyrate kinase